MKRAEKDPSDEAIYEIARDIVHNLSCGLDVLASSGADDMRELFAASIRELGEAWSDPEECTRDTQVALDVAKYVKTGGAS